MRRIINGKFYDTDTMGLLWESGRDGAGVGRKIYVYVTSKSRTLIEVTLTRWQDESDGMRILCLEDCLSLYPACAEWLPPDILDTVPIGD